MRNPSVWVVLAEEGEYSYRDVWVAGVYLNEEAAVTKLFERLRVRRVWDQWDHSLRMEVERAREKRCESLVRQSPDGKIPGRSIMTLEEDRAEAKKIAGPEPEREPAERLAVIEVPVATWGKHGGPYEKDVDWKSPEYPTIDVENAT